MAWTPALVLEYARSLRVAIDPPPLGLVTLTALAANPLRARREFIATVRARAAAAAAAPASQVSKTSQKTRQ